MALTTYSPISSLSQEQIIQAFGQIVQKQQELMETNEHLKEENKEAYNQLQTIISLVQGNLLPKIQELTLEQAKNKEIYEKHLAICGPTITTLTEENTKLQQRISQLEAQNETEKTTHEQALQSLNSLIKTQNDKTAMLENKIEANTIEKQQIRTRLQNCLAMELDSDYTDPIIRPYLESHNKQVVEHVLTGSFLDLSPIVIKG